jgi:hypothetical protein
LSNFQGSDEDWIDEDDAPELTGAELFHRSGKFLIDGVEVSHEVGRKAFGKKFRDVYAQQKQTIKVIHFKKRTQQHRQLIAQMRLTNARQFPFDRRTDDKKLDF